MRYYTTNNRGEISDCLWTLVGVIAASILLRGCEVESINSRLRDVESSVNSVGGDIRGTNYEIRNLTNKLADTNAELEKLRRAYERSASR